jgi:hypothetical protein
MESVEIDLEQDGIFLADNIAEHLKTFISYLGAPLE